MGGLDQRLYLVSGWKIAGTIRILRSNIDTASIDPSGPTLLKFIPMKKIFASRSHFEWIAPFGLFTMAIFLVACVGLNHHDATTSAEAVSDFEEIVKPLFEHRCVWCHNDREPKAGLNMQSRSIVFNSSLRFVVPGKPEQSLIYTAIERHPQHLKAMPADGWKITDRQAQAIRNWIRGGAPWPDGREGEIRKKDYRVDLDEYL